ITVRSNFSLVLAHPQLSLNDPAAWRLSVEPNGTPGVSDSISFSGTATDDFDHDGFPALVEYALGTDDHDPNSGRDDVVASVDAFGNLTLSFPRRLGADDVILQCENSEDLVNWQSARLLSTDFIGNGIARETWGITRAGGRAQFLRLNLRSLA